MEKPQEPQLHHLRITKNSNQLYAYFLLLLSFAIGGYQIYSHFFKDEIEINYHSNGNKKMVIINKALSDQIIEKHYFENGKLKSFYNGNSEKLSGVQMEYDSLGVLREEYSYEDGIQSGNHKWYHANSILHTKVKMVNGIKQGKQPHYYDNGKLKSIAHYENGEIYKLQMPKSDSIVSSATDTIAYWPILNYATEEFSIGDTIAFEVQYPISELNLSSNDSLFFRYGVTMDTAKIYNPHLEILLSDSIQNIRFLAEGSGKSFLFGLITHVTDSASYNHPVVYREINTR